MVDGDAEKKKLRVRKTGLKKPVAVRSGVKKPGEKTGLKKPALKKPAAGKTGPKKSAGPRAKKPAVSKGSKAPATQAGKAGAGKKAGVRKPRAGKSSMASSIAQDRARMRKKGGRKKGGMGAVMMAGNDKPIEEVCKKAKITGVLALQNRDFKEVPPLVATLAAETLGENWWECIPLKALDLSHNELSSLPLAMFCLLDDEGNVTERKAEDERPPPTIKQVEQLTLNHNKFQTLPEVFSELSNLKELFITHNQLAELPQSLGCLTELTTVDLSNNNLAIFPQCLSQLSKLKTLSLDHNALTQLPQPTALSLPALDTLSVAHNKLEQIPELSGFPRLLKLVVRHNKLRNLPFLGDLQQLTTLDASGNKLRDIADLSVLSQLTTLNVNNNQILEMPVLPKSLKCLRMSCNGLRSVQGLHGLTKLRTLELMENQVEEWPASLCPELSSIKTLHLAKNYLLRLPKELALVSSLEKLSISGNTFVKMKGLTDLKDEVHVIQSYLRQLYGDGEGGEESMQGVTSAALAFDAHGLNSSPEAIALNRALQAAEASQVLKLTGPTPVRGRKEQARAVIPTALTQVPPAVLQLPNIKDIDVSHHRLEALPEGWLTESLRILTAENNLLSSLPVLPSSLREVWLSRNQLSCLPSFEHLTCLTSIDLSNNKLASLPEDLLELPALKSLHLANNQLGGEIPDCSEMMTLEVLDVCGNAFDSFSWPVHVLPELHTLLLESNNLSSLPLELAACKRLRTLTVIGNPLRTIRTAVISKGTVGIINYLKNKIPFGDPLQELVQ